MEKAELDENLSSSKFSSKTEAFSERISGEIDAKTGVNESNLLVTGSRNHSACTPPYPAKKGTLFDNHSHVA